MTLSDLLYFIIVTEWLKYHPGFMFSFLLSRLRQRSRNSEGETSDTAFYDGYQRVNQTTDVDNVIVLFTL